MQVLSKEEAMAELVRRTGEAGDTFRRELTQVNVNLLESERFTEAQEITSILQKLSDLQGRFKGILQGTSSELEPRSGLSQERKSAGKFPRFERRADDLIKIGQSRDGSQYEQKCPRSAWVEIISVLERHSSQESGFAAKEISSEIDSPSYQVYLVLNFLQDRGLLKSPGRGEYRLAAHFDHKQAEAAWDGSLEVAVDARG